MLDRDLLVQQYSLFTTVHTDNAYNVTESNLSFPTVKSSILTTEDLEGKILYVRSPHGAYTLLFLTFYVPFLILTETFFY